MRKSLLILVFAGSHLLARDLQSTLPPDMRVPANQKMLFRARGVGDQIYTCKAIQGKFMWTLKAPDARLLGNDGRVLGHHFAGPTWKANDSSSVVGKAVARLASPDPNSVAWLLVHVIRHDGKGVMTHVLTVQRLETKGGKPPANSCNKSHTGAEIRIPYTAEYYFYGINK